MATATRGAYTPQRQLSSTSSGPSTLTASLSEDECDLLSAIFGDEVAASAEWSRTHGIATLRLSLNFTGGNDMGVAVVLRFTSVASGPLGTTHTEFSAPELDEVATTTLSMATTATLAQAVADHGLEGATLVGEPANVDPIKRDWVFASGGWLVGLVGALKEHLESDNRFSGCSCGGGGGGATSSGLSGGIRTNSTTSFNGSPMTVAKSLGAAAGGSGVVLTARAYRLTHMRRPVEYVRTLQSWISNAGFNGQRGFVSSAIVTDIGTINVYVAALHIEVIEPGAKADAQTVTAPSAAAQAELAGSAGIIDFSVLERLWKTQPVDTDVRGKPCFERLMRVVADSRELVDSVAPVVAALERSRVPMRVGEVAHTVIGVGHAEVPAWVGTFADRTAVEAVILHTVGLEPWAASSTGGSFDSKSAAPTATRSKAAGGGSPAPSAVGSKGGSQREGTNGAGGLSCLFPTFVSEVAGGTLFT